MMRRSLWIGSGVAVVVIMAGLLVYGSYISAQYQMEALKTSAREQWVQLNGSLHRWAEVAPQVEAAVSPAATQNGAALEELASARKKLLQARDPQALTDAGRFLNQALNAVMAIGLSEPKLQNDVKFRAARERLRTMGVRIAQDRERYNESLRDYDLFVGEFPNSIWAKIAGYKPDHRFFPRFAGES